MHTRHRNCAGSSRRNSRLKVMRPLRENWQEPRGRTTILSVPAHRPFPSFPRTFQTIRVEATVFWYTLTVAGIRPESRVNPFGPREGFAEPEDDRETRVASATLPRSKLSNVDVPFSTVSSQTDSKLPLLSSSLPRPFSRNRKLRRSIGEQREKHDKAPIRINRFQLGQGLLKKPRGAIALFCINCPFMHMVWV